MVAIHYPAGGSLIGGFYLLNQSRNENAKTNAVTSAAKNSGCAPDQVGDAVTGDGK